MSPRFVWVDIPVLDVERAIALHGAVLAHGSSDGADREGNRVALHSATR